MESFLIKEIDIREDEAMRGKRFSPEQIIRIIKESELGIKNIDICRKYGISEQTFLMEKEKFKAYTLVSIQVISIVLILVTGWPLAGYKPLLIIQIAGVTLGIWAFIAMGWYNLHIAPLVNPDARLVTSGPYTFIRHPMYSAVLLTLWPLIMDQYSFLRLAAGLILTADLIIKMLYEESLLKKHFAGYEIYMRETKRLIPFVI
jgi:protein-S-isoprenylcysteine O-methyltransferase Ste14